MKRAYTRYSDNQVIAEAYLVLTGCLYKDVSSMLKMPISTVGWHMKYRLKDVDKELYHRVRKIINRE